MSLNVLPYAGLHYSERNEFHKNIFKERIKFLIKAGVLKKSSSVVINSINIKSGGSTTVGYNNRSFRNIGIMIAGNSGLPWGNCGKHNNTYEPNISKLINNHSTQEESVISNWMKTTFNIPKNNQSLLNSRINEINKIYISTTKGRWGMENLNSYSVKTIQGIDYTRTKNPLSYSDAWVVSNCKLSKSGYSNKKVIYEGPSNHYNTNLIFVAGPNVAAQGSSTGTMKRTLNKNLDYPTFRECVKQAFKAGLKAMILSNIKIAILAKVSGGIYAGPEGSDYRTKINNDYNKIITELLNERLISGSNITYSDYFNKVFI